MHTKKSRGFTLIELMVVMGILAVLMAMILPAVTGIKGASLESQALSDGNSVQKAVDRFNSQSTKDGVFPEVPAFSGTGALYATEAFVTSFKDKRGNVMGTTETTNADGSKNLVKPSATTHTAMKWDATVRVWLKDGSLDTQTFVPTYMGKSPESTSLMADEDGYGNYHEFLWLLRKAASSEGETRKVEVYRLKPDTTGVAYFQIH